MIVCGDGGLGLVTYDMILIICMFQIVHFIKCITLHLDISLIFYYEQTVK